MCIPNTISSSDVIPDLDGDSTINETFISLNENVNDAINSFESSEVSAFDDIVSRSDVSHTDSNTI